MKMFLGYIRSPSSETELSVQRLTVEEFARTQGAEIQLFSDLGVPYSRLYQLGNSGGTGLWSLMSFSRAERPDGIVVPSLGTFGRSLAWVHILLTRFKGDGIPIYTVRDPKPIDLELILPGIAEATEVQGLLDRERNARLPSRRSRPNQGQRSSWSVTDVLGYMKVGPAARLRNSLIEGCPRDHDAVAAATQSSESGYSPCTCWHCLGLHAVNEIEGLIRTCFRKLDEQAERTRIEDANVPQEPVTAESLGSPPSDEPGC
jgi:hypothetical protein